VDERTLARFMSWVEIQPNGCWRWKGKLNKNGYGYFWFEGKSRLVHRFAYEHFVGPIPEGYEVDHTCHTRDESCPGGRCDHRACVCPDDHLEAVTSLVNVMRSRGLAAANAAKDVCINGHNLTEDNTYWYPGGRERGCRICRADANKAWREENRPAEGPRNADKTHCKNNHIFDEANTYLIPKGGGRACKTCRRDSNRETKRAQRARKKAAAEAAATT
jgi:hypothetical protein